MDTASRVVTEEARNVFPFGIVFNDQMFGLSIVAAGHLEEDREKHTGNVAWPDSTVLFHLLNRGLWDQQLVDAPQEVLSGFDGLGLLNGQFLSSTGLLVFGKQADLCQVRCALDNKFLRVNRFTILPEDNLMSL